MTNWRCFLNAQPICVFFLIFFLNCSSSSSGATEEAHCGYLCSFTVQSHWIKKMVQKPECKHKEGKSWNLTVVFDGEMEEVGRGVFFIPQHVADVHVFDISCKRKLLFSLLIFFLLFSPKNMTKYQSWTRYKTGICATVIKTKEDIQKDRTEVTRKQQQMFSSNS